MQCAGTRLDPVTAAAGSAHAKGRKGRSAGGAPLRGWGTKAFAKIRLGSLTHGLRWTEGRCCWRWGMGVWRGRNPQQMLHCVAPEYQVRSH